jgi:transcriptional regulator with XRE-family HTH domain
MVRESIAPAISNLRSIAEDLGVPYDTLGSWVNGQRAPAPGNLRKLADHLERRGDELVRHARLLRKAANVADVDEFTQALEGDKGKRK